MTPNQAAGVAFDRYMQASAALALIAGTQPDLLEHTDAQQRAAFWRATWMACEAEAIRVEDRS